MTTFRNRVLATVGATAIALGLAVGVAGIAKADNGFDTGGHVMKTAQAHVTITNDTAQELVLTRADQSGAGVHWEQPATDLAPGATEVVSAYAAGGLQVDLTFTGAADGASYRLTAGTPLVGGNLVSGRTDSSDSTIDAHAGTGYDPTDTFVIG